MMLGHGKLDRLHMHLRTLFHEQFEVNPDSLEVDWEVFASPPFTEAFEDRRKIVIVMDVTGERL